MLPIFLLTLSALGGAEAPLTGVLLQGSRAYGPNISFQIGFHPEKTYKCHFQPVTRETFLTQPITEVMAEALRLTGAPVPSSARFSGRPSLIIDFSADLHTTFTAVDLSRNLKTKHNGINPMRLMALLCPPTLLDNEVWEEFFRTTTRYQRRFWAHFWTEYLTVTRSLLPGDVLLNTRRTCVQNGYACAELVTGAEDLDLLDGSPDRIRQ